MKIHPFQQSLSTAEKEQSRNLLSLVLLMFPEGKEQGQSIRSDGKELGLLLSFPCSLPDWGKDIF